MKNKQAYKHYSLEEVSISLKQLFEQYGEDALRCLEEIPYEGTCVTIARLENIEPSKPKRKS